MPVWFANTLLHPIACSISIKSISETGKCGQHPTACLGRVAEICIPVLGPKSSRWLLADGANYSASEPRARAQPWCGCFGGSKHEGTDNLPTKHSCIVTPCTLANNNSETEGFINMASNSMKHPACTIATHTRCLPSPSISEQPQL